MKILVRNEEGSVIREITDVEFSRPISIGNVQIEIEQEASDVPPSVDELEAETAAPVETTATNT